MITSLAWVCHLLLEWGCFWRRWKLALSTVNHCEPAHTQTQASLALSMLGMRNQISDRWQVCGNPLDLLG